MEIFYNIIIFYYILLMKQLLIIIWYGMLKWNHLSIQ